MSLIGITVVVTRAQEQSTELVRLLRAAGAQVVEVPLVRIVPLSGVELQRFDAACDHLETFAAVVFTSQNAVGIAAERLRARGRLRELAQQVVFAVGPATARALLDLGVTALEAEQAVAESLLQRVRAHFGDALVGKRLLWPRGRESRDVLMRGLTDSGAQLEAFPLYETQALLEGPVLPVTYDWLTFASPSAVRAFVSRFGVAPVGRVACIGPVTASAARGLGLAVDAVAQPHTSAGLVAAMDAT